jgi:hypothetical protein
MKTFRHIIGYTLFGAMVVVPNIISYVYGGWPLVGLMYAGLCVTLGMLYLIIWLLK